jgi:NhaP-type Na+/H+ or K+/H+ antiporter
MMVMAPLISYLIAESLSISGLISLMTCAYTISVYAKKNLPNDRNFIINNVFEAVSYFSRTICDLLLGLGFGIYFRNILTISIFAILASFIFTFTLDLLLTYAFAHAFIKRKQID